MQIIISPAKKMDFSVHKIPNKSTIPKFINEANELVLKLKKYNPSQLADLLNVNPNIAKLNYERFINWKIPFTKNNAKEAILAYTGEVFQKLKAKTFSEEDLNFTQNSILILSGLFGILKPLDLIQPYRLEMATKLENNKGDNLYKFWENKINNYLNEIIEKTKSSELINLASQEYFKAIQPKKIKTPIIKPIFKDFKNGEYKTIFIYAKQARGMMCNFIIKNKILKAEDIKHFDSSGYHFDANLSDSTNWVFTR